MNATLIKLFERYGLEALPERHFPRDSCCFIPGMVSDNKDFSQATPEYICLMYSIQTKNMNAFTKILSEPNNKQYIYIPNTYGETPFLFAILDEYAHEFAYLLFMLGSDINHMPNHPNLDVLTWDVLYDRTYFKCENIYESVCMHGNCNLFDLLVQEGYPLANFLVKNIHGISPYMVAKRFGHTHIVNKLQTFKKSVKENTPKIITI
jgi:ankyrin repeat protein